MPLVRLQVTICAPMVRYSKLPFRLAVRKWGTDIAYTPMIMADSFVNSCVDHAALLSTLVSSGRTTVGL
jgi:tRNA-dihydrouridine synthase